MAGDTSAFAALGLEPGADAAAVEQAYRRLIKQHHPDREGGDSARAAEINRAYHELKAARSNQEVVAVHGHADVGPRTRWGWTAIALILVIGFMSLPLLSERPLLPPLQFGSVSLGTPRAVPWIRAKRSDAMDGELHVDAIDQSVRSAIRLSRASDEMTLARTTRNCHQGIRRHPDLVQFDRCTAFDDAVVRLQDRDPLRDQGPFSEIAVTGRIWGSATTLSSDSLAVDGRLDRIRRRVQFLLGPAAMVAAQD